MTNNIDHQNPEAMEAEFKRLALIAHDRAKGLGAQETKVSCSRNQSLSVVCENNEIKLATSAEDYTFAVRVHREQCKGSTSTNELNEKRILESVERAFEISKYSVPDYNLKLLDKHKAGDVQPLNFLCDLHASEFFSLEYLESLLHKGLQVLAKDKRIALDRFDISLNIDSEALFLSTGVERSERRTELDWSYLAIARDGKKVSGMDYDGSSSFKLSGTENELESELHAFAERLLSSLEPQKCTPYQGSVILSPRVIEDLVFDPILYQASGHQVMDGRSKWADKIGTFVASPKLNLIDDPHSVDFSGATSYDMDGSATRKQALIENGVLKCHLHDLYSASKLNVELNSMCGGPFGLILKPGPVKLADFFGAEKQILLLERFSGNLDPLTGDFSGTAKNSRLIRNGKDVGAAKETMIAGNIFDVLKNIKGISKEVMNVGKSYSAPYILAEGFSVSS